MRGSTFAGILVLALTAATGPACSSGTGTGIPTVPSPADTTETFSGTLTVNGALTFPFTVTQAGTAVATITALNPAASVVVNAGGTGNFIVGEKVYQGAVDAPTTTAFVYSWDAVTRVLGVRDITGTIVLDASIIGVDSQAEWVATSAEAPIVGIALGTWSGTTCTIVLANDLSGISSNVNGLVQGAGQLCARVYDVGKLALPATFTINVVHQ